MKSNHSTFPSTMARVDREVAVATLETVETLQAERDRLASLCLWKRAKAYEPRIRAARMASLKASNRAVRHDC